MQEAQPDAGKFEVVASPTRGDMEGNSDAALLPSKPHNHNDPMLGMADNLRRIVLGTPSSFRFLGKSGERMLVETAVEFKKEHTGDEGVNGNPQKSGPKNRRDNFWGDKPVRYTISYFFCSP